MPRFNVTMPQELWDRAGDVAPEGNRSWFIRRALEAALDDGGSPVTGTAGIGGPAVAAPPSPVSPRASARKPAAVPGVSRASELFRNTEKACPSCDEPMAERSLPGSPGKPGVPMWVCPSCGTREKRTEEK